MDFAACLTWGWVWWWLLDGPPSAIAARLAGLTRSQLGRVIRGGSSKKEGGQGKRESFFLGRNSFFFGGGLPLVWHAARRNMWKEPPAKTSENGSRKMKKGRGEKRWGVYDNFGFRGWFVHFMPQGETG